MKSNWSTKQCYLFDLDGTLADGSHRMKHFNEQNWPAYQRGHLNDARIVPVWNIARALSACFPLVFLSTRREWVREETQQWLDDQLLPGELYLKEIDDNRPDDIAKIHLLSRIRADGWEPLLAFEDLTIVANAYRNIGLPCAHIRFGQERWK